MTYIEIWLSKTDSVYQKEYLNSCLLASSDVFSVFRSCARHLRITGNVTIRIPAAITQ